MDTIRSIYSEQHRPTERPCLEFRTSDFHPKQTRPESFFRWRSEMPTNDVHCLTYGDADVSRIFAPVALASWRK